MIEEIAERAYNGEPMPAGMEGGLDAQVIYDPPNLTYPFGAYICVVDIDPDTAQVTIRRLVAVDDCGVRINPMVVEGQIHGGLAEGVGIALMELISFDSEGNCLNSSFMDYLIPTALETPTSSSARRSRRAASPARRQGRRRVAERRISAGDRQRGDRRAARDPRGRPHRHAVYPGPGVGGDAGAPGHRNDHPGAVAAAAELAARPFVIATVVRVQRPTSVEAGSVAIVLADGTVEGFVGGVRTACARTRWWRFATSSRCCESSRPRPRVRARGGGGVERGRRRHGRQPLPVGRDDRGLPRPAPPAPRIVVIGDTPIMGALARIGGELGWRWSPPTAATPSRRPATSRSSSPRTGATSSTRCGGRSRRTFPTSASSPARSAARGSSPSCARPAFARSCWSGSRCRLIPIGSHAPARSPSRSSPGSSRCGAEPRAALRALAAQTAGVAVDPICGMTVAAVESSPSVERDGETVYFCSEGCKAEFEAREHASVAH